MRESLRKVRDICFPDIDDGKWLSNIDNTQWLHHLHCILSGAVKIAERVKRFLGMLLERVEIFKSLLVLKLFSF